MTNLSRRNLLRGLIAAPAVVAIGNIMLVRSIERLLIPTLWGDGLHEDSAGLQAYFAGKPFLYNGIYRLSDTLPCGSYLAKHPIEIAAHNLKVVGSTFNFRDGGYLFGKKPLENLLFSERHFNAMNNVRHAFLDTELPASDKTISTDDRLLFPNDDWLPERST